MVFTKMVCLIWSLSENIFEQISQYSKTQAGILLQDKHYSFDLDCLSSSLKPLNSLRQPKKWLVEH